MESAQPTHFVINSRTAKKANALTVKPSNKVPAVMRKYWGQYTPTDKTGLVLSPTFTNASQRETYRTGDGDTPTVYRPGALDFMKCPSRGF